MPVHYHKLRNGTWGIKLTGEPLPEVGASVTVEKKNEEKKTEVIRRIVWANQRENVYICSIEG